MSAILTLVYSLVAFFTARSSSSCFSIFISQAFLPVLVADHQRLRKVAVTFVGRYWPG
ncbi:hypothetical protein B0H11DRAFT_2198945 [Mycena galericulata]|nr:hypothetical protein B0H11DRAFT_2198945 [Mycena galericulata]